MGRIKTAALNYFKAAVLDSSLGWNKIKIRQEIHEYRFMLLLFVLRL